jgi:phage-related protein
MAWEIIFYETGTGRSYPKKFLRSIARKARVKCSTYIAMLEERGYDLPTPYLEKVRGKIWALRPEFGGNEYRIFFFDAGNNKFVITHIVHKTTNKIDPGDIKMAESRMDDWLNRQAAERKK